MENIEQTADNIREMMGNAIRGKMETEDMYRELSERSESIFLTERFKFLAREEEEQREVLERLASEIFGASIDIPENSGLPLPDIRNMVGSGRMPVEDLIKVMEKAKIANEETQDMYLSMSEFFLKDSPERKLLEYLAYMEEEHYYLLERKIMKLKKFGFV